MQYGYGWSVMSLKIIPFALESILSILIVKILSIRVPVCSVCYFIQCIKLPWDIFPFRIMNVIFTKSPM